MVARRPPSNYRVTLLLATLALPACGQRRMVRTSGQIRSHVRSGNYEAALFVLQQSKSQGFRPQDRVVYWMNEGLLLHLLGRYQQSNRALDAADKRAEELFTTSIRKSMGAAFTSPAATDYQGEDYEKVLLNVMMALNYLQLGQLDEALVEARKINDKLRYYNTKYGHKNVYSQDAFAHWLAGMLFEMDKSYDDARISFERALAVYRKDFAQNYGLSAPQYLAEDLVRVARLAGDEDLARRYAQDLEASGTTVEALESRGEIVLIHLNGAGPSKSDFFVTCWFRDVNHWRCNGKPSGEFISRTRIHIPQDGTVVKVAFPRLHLRNPASAYVTVRAGGATARSQPAYPLNAIAAKTLRDKTHRIFRDAIIRVITKAASQQVAGAAGKEAGGDLGSWLAKTATSMAMQIAEEADKRAWTTLPARIDVARLLVAPGTHDVELGLADGRHATIPQVKVAANNRVFITHRSLP